jgi:hypothetical protein
MMQVLTIIMMLMGGLLFSSPLPASESGSGMTYRVYFLGGQSNMEGFGYSSELPAEWLGPVDKVRIFTGQMKEDNQPGGGVGSWQPLQPGFGTGFITDGETQTLSGRFGPELAFGKRLSDLMPGERIAIIKYARGGSALEQGASGFGTWAPDFEEGNGINQYDHALATIRTALSMADIDGDGKTDTLLPAGIIWMQGEADAYHSVESARSYRQNLKRMMDLLRAALRVDDLPVVIGLITDSGQAEDGSMMDYIEIVQQAQMDYSNSDRCATLVTETRNLGYIEDGWHYDTEGFLSLGARFADAVHTLEADCPPR